MSGLKYNNQQELEFHGVPLHSLVSAEGPPTYVYSRESLRKRLDLFKARLQEALAPRPFFIHYAVKANSHPELLTLFKQQGIGVDIVSGGELERSQGAGFAGAQIIFSGVAKTKDEIRRCLAASIGQFNVESLPELQRIAELARASRQIARVVLRINPDVDPETHPYISTGMRENKFGIETAMIPECLQFLSQHPELEFIGLSSHVGSQMREFSAFREALRKQRELYEQLIGQGYPLSVFDIGGGLGIEYGHSDQVVPDSQAWDDLLQDEGDLTAYCQVLKEELRGMSARIQLEPGRFLVARAGVLLTEIQYIKKTTERHFILCNSGMHHLIRPALYEAYHRILPLRSCQGEVVLADVVGPVCESSDFLGKQRKFQGLEPGDWLCVADVGAYGAAMSSDYNLFSRPREIFI
jgi:diaminopimelate decarboxylase